MSTYPFELFIEAPVLVDRSLAEKLSLREGGDPHA